jgi:hypothetical protein
MMSDMVCSSLKITSFFHEKCFLCKSIHMLGESNTNKTNTNNIAAKIAIKRLFSMKKIPALG